MPRRVLEAKIALVHSRGWSWVFLSCRCIAFAFAALAFVAASICF